MAQVKKFLRKIAPVFLRTWYQKLRSRSLSRKNVKDVFSEIKHSNVWGSPESVSGAGSERSQTEFLVPELGRLLKARGVKTLLDIPCGDFNWMKNVDLSGVRYTGADIVNDLIQGNTLRYKAENIDFRVLNLITDDLPKNDVVFVRDCLVHLSYKDIFSALENIKKSGSRYLLTTTFTNRRKNYDIVTGDWRTLNLLKPPFNFPEPLQIIVEHCTEDGDEYIDKSIALWDLKAL